MAIPSNVFKQFDAVGDREDLIDIITNIDPVNTYVTSNTGSKRAGSIYHEWQTDALDTAAANAQLEGDDATASAVTPTTRTGNYVQILRKVFAVSDIQESMDKAGRASEIAYQKAKHLKMLARDIEYALILNTASCVGSSNAARTLKGLDGWISTNCTYGGASVGAAVTRSEGQVKTTLQTIWAAGGRPQTALVGGFQKLQFDAFSTNTREIAADSQMLVSAVDIYKGSFGTLKVIPHQQIDTSIPSKILILGDMELWNKAWLSPVKSEQLARTGMSTKFQIVAALTLESL